MIPMFFFSVTLIPLLFVSPWTWGGLATAAAALWASRSVSRNRTVLAGRRNATQWGLAYLIVVPLLTLVAGTVLWKKWEDPNFVPLIPQHISEQLVLAIALLQIPVSILVVWRRRPMPLMEAAETVAALIWTYSCSAVSMMAVTGDWL